ncbi:MAG: cytochrome c biogenesis protein CcsA [Candidatus Omnitrophica bacterium]|nr:cytochrome c biogenesis protein CcsA [Candidatus Omnitrophota bacterium]
MAIGLLLTIAAVLGWGTFYEARYGTAAVQRFVYHSGWFQGLLAFLALNLAAAALRRFPWQRRHLPFVMAHLGIILTLAGGILGGRLGIEGQMIIPEGETRSTLERPGNVLILHEPNPGIDRIFPTHFEAAAWNHHPHEIFTLPLKGQPIQLVVDRYYPNADPREEVTDRGTEENPALHLTISREGEAEEQGIWLFARDPDRFGARWGGSHLFYLAPESDLQFRKLSSEEKQRAPFPANSIILLRAPAGRRIALLTDASRRRRRIDPLEVGKAYRHPALGVRFRVDADYPRAELLTDYVNRGDEVKAEVLHVVASDGKAMAQGWLPLRGAIQLPLAKEPLEVRYQPALARLPFSVKLLDFRKIDYPGISMAAGFESDLELTDPSRGLTLKRTIRMNSPLKYRGYTFYQSSYIPGPFDPAQGRPSETTVLSVRNDPGTPLVYEGFLIIVAGVVLMFRAGAAAAAMIAFGFVSGPLFAQAEGVGAGIVAPAALEQLRLLAVQHNGRNKPLDSFAREALDQITGSPQWKGEDPVRTLLSILSDPDRWREAPLISVPFVPLREALGLGPKSAHLSYNDLVSTRRLMRMLPAIVGKQQADEKLTLLENETMDLYERFVLLSGLLEQKLHLVPPPHSTAAPSPVPDPWLELSDPAGYSPAQQGALKEAWGGMLTAMREGPPEEQEASARRLTVLLRSMNPAAYPPLWRLRLEVFYNQARPFRWARILYGIGALALWAGWIGWAKGAGAASCGMKLVWAGFLLHGGGILLRVILGGRPPVSNFYETTLWLPFVAVTLSLLLGRIYRQPVFPLAGALLAAGVLVLADHLPLDPSISPVVAVLRSNLWLTIHVLTIVASYGALSLAMVLAHLFGGLVLAGGAKHPALDSLDAFLYRTIQVGVVLLAAGIMLGAVWANASWGRYWGWDPKETWALITLLWFLAVLHGRFAGWLKGADVAVATIARFFLLLMTYYGVSFYLVGLHSYAGGHAKPIPPLLLAYLVAEVAFMSWVGWYNRISRRSNV